MVAVAIGKTATDATVFLLAVGTCVSSQGKVLLSLSFPIQIRGEHSIENMPWILEIFESAGNMSVPSSPDFRVVTLLPTQFPAMICHQLTQLPQRWGPCSTTFLPKLGKCPQHGHHWGLVMVHGLGTSSPCLGTVTPRETPCATDPIAQQGALPVLPWFQHVSTLTSRHPLMISFTPERAAEAGQRTKGPKGTCGAGLVSVVERLLQSKTCTWNAGNVGHVGHVGHIKVLLKAYQNFQLPLEIAPTVSCLWFFRQSQGSRLWHHWRWLL